MSGMSGKFVNTSIPRDRMLRPLVIPKEIDPKKPDKRTPYRRVTRFISVLEDRYNLEQHAYREIVWGMGQRRDLVTLAASIPGNWSESGDGKTTLAGQKDSIADQARDYAKTRGKSNLGTALHSFCENLDRGLLDPNSVPPEHRDDLAAYARTCQWAGITHKQIETFRVHDDWRVAGTADRVVEIGGVHYIADIKTGKIEFDGAVLKMAMQMAMYAHSVPYDIGADTRTADPWPINMQRALIIHLPVETGECTLHWVDIEKGWRACGVAKSIWDTRDSMKRKDIMWDFAPGELPAKQSVVIPNAEEYIRRVSIAKSVDDLVSLWTAAKWAGELTEAFKQAFIDHLSVVSSVDDLIALWQLLRADGHDTPDFVQRCAERKAQILAMAS